MYIRRELNLSAVAEPANRVELTFLELSTTTCWRLILTALPDQRRPLLGIMLKVVGVFGSREIILEMPSNRIPMY